MISKASKYLKSFDVRVFFIPKGNSILTFHIKSIEILEILRCYGMFSSLKAIRNRYVISKASKYLKSFDVRVFLFTKTSQHQYFVSKAWKYLKSFDVMGCFHHKRQFGTDMWYRKHRNTWNPSTLRFFSFQKAIR